MNAADKRTGIIDIGSNSIRLVIYELKANGGYRIIDESKETARLSSRLKNGILGEKDIQMVADILYHFKQLCEVYQTEHIRAAATAAVRNARNRREIVETVRRKTGLHIEVLSGEEEARYGFIGMINTIDVEDGFLVDIGGGSTEVTLFQQREIVHTHSFPFGAVNTAQHTAKLNKNGRDEIAAIRQMVERALKDTPWIRQHPGLPLVGLGGTIRTLSKLHRRRINYSLPLTHNYTMTREDMNSLLQLLTATPLEKRKKMEGLSKGRADIIIPGTVILLSLFEYMKADHYIVSGSGLREGLFFSTIRPQKAKVDNVLEYSVRNLLALYPSVNVHHVKQVNRLALQIFDVLKSFQHLPKKSRTYLHVSSLLYRIGVTVDYYHYPQHTYYLLAHSRLNGLSHREILMCAMIASYKSKKMARQIFRRHRDILSPEDLRLIERLGTLFRLAIALDRIQTQPISGLKAVLSGKELSLHVKYRRFPSIELKEADALKSDFKKLWGLQLKICD